MIEALKFKRIKCRLIDENGFKKKHRIPNQKKQTVDLPVGPAGLRTKDWKETKST